MAEKLSDLTASHTPVLAEISIELSWYSLSEMAVDNIINIVFDSSNRLSNYAVDKFTTSYVGAIDAKMIPYICFRLETGLDYEHADNPVVLEAVGRIERYLKKVYSDYFPKAEVEPEIEAAKDYSKLTMPDLKAQAQEASKAINKTLGNLAKKVEKTTPSTAWTPAPEDEKLAAVASQSFYDDVSHPSYYDLPSGMESKDVIRAALGDQGYEQWCLGTSLKYLFRYPNKENPVKDLNKAKQYIDFILELRQEED